MRILAPLLFSLIAIQTAHAASDMAMMPMQQAPVSESVKQGDVTISPVYQQALGVKINPVVRHDFGSMITTYGRIVHSTRHEYDLAVRSGGWIVDLPASAVGDVVKKGDLLFTLYSPGILTSQLEYLLGKSGSGRELTDQRLLLSGMDDKAIALFKQKGQLLRETPFYAPMGGTLTVLNAHRGSFVKEGDTVLQLHDFSEVWAEASVPLQYLPQITAGTKATLSIPDLGKTYSTTVDLIYPVIDEQSRTATARMVLANSDGTLKPDTYVDVSFETATRSVLTVPDNALLHDKMGAYVFRATGDGHFMPVMVKTGISSGGLTEIVSGLTEGQNIVSSGQFMIDAESNLQGTMQEMGMSHE